MTQAPKLDEVIANFLEGASPSEKADDNLIAELLREFMQFLFGESGDDVSPIEDISLSELGAFELDEFLNFFLPDMMPEDPQIQKKGKTFLSKFRKFLIKKSLLSKEQLEDWKEFFQENKI
ncbi:hypothetical protein CH373_05845 [Leptospira perolatii]|uniref:Uncharacterized protein n=1 Tax=Leptospira perolatii TaxID=2023191 RepID=A0A2M9ZQQ3_9LEPT|nr:hypothetical protein [Leptospira perolatii]PJZ68387.1 hypothetical protein CH360_16560 [Leptospira perolatii]PJZ74417.1 hypothetical protein CH373_05845 [Leptospira perolatii]